MGERKLRKRKGYLYKRLTEHPLLVGALNEFHPNTENIYWKWSRVIGGLDYLAPP
jgi:hypothetical protein